MSRGQHSTRPRHPRFDSIPRNPARGHIGYYVTLTIPGMMLLVYSPNAALQKRLRMTTDMDLIVVSRWSQVEKRIAHAACFVADLVSLTDDTIDRFCLLRSRLTLLPIVAIVKKDPVVAIALKDVAIEEIIWSDRIEDELMPATVRALSKGRLNRIAAAVRTNERFTSLTKQFLTLVLLAKKPFTEVSAVAEVLGVDTKTITNQWKQSGIRTRDLTPKASIDWIVLMRAAALRTAGYSREQVGNEINVHPRTLDRMARRLMGKPMSFAQAVTVEPETDFAKQALPALFGADLPDLLNFSAICHYA